MLHYIGNEIRYLLPGETIVTSQAMKISTILGSCVSVCLYSPVEQIAGMNHFVLPWNKQNDSNRSRYGDSSIEDMILKMIRTGAIKKNISAQIYGGSSMFINSEHGFRIGEKNIESALKTLKIFDIPVIYKETGGNAGRRIIFDTSSEIITSTLIERQRIK